jgi:hypothetical protein
MSVNLVSAKSCIKLRAKRMRTQDIQREKFSKAKAAQPKVY